MVIKSSFVSLKDLRSGALVLSNGLQAVRSRMSQEEPALWAPVRSWSGNGVCSLLVCVTPFEGLYEVSEGLRIALQDARCRGYWKR